MEQKAYSKRKDIDPAFNIIIEEFSKSFDLLLKIPDNKGAENILGKIDGSETKSFKPFYEGNVVMEVINNMAAVMGNKQYGDQMKSIAAGGYMPPDMIYKISTDSAKDLNPESRKYYHQVFEIFSSTDRYNELVSGMTEEEKKELEQDVEADFNALLFRRFIVEKEKADIEKVKQNVEQKLNLNQILVFNFVALDRLSLIINKKSMNDLYKEAKDDGNEKSLIKLLQLDKTLFDHEWVRDLMLKATATGDNKFLKKISYAIMSGPPAGKLKQGKLEHILVSCWGMGLYRLSMKELRQLLDKCKIETYEDLETLRSLVDNQIKPFFPQYS